SVVEKDVALNNHGKVKIEFPVKRPRKWSAEDPYLYHFVVCLRDQQGNNLEVLAQKVGFRTVELKDGLMLINGNAITLKGVNRHDNHPELGRAVTIDDMYRDIILMKQCNLN